MGHSRLGWLPQTYAWQDVIALIADGASADAIADATLDAARKGLEQAVRDPGLRQVFLLLAEVALASRKGNFALELAGLGVPVKGAPSAFELVGAFTDAIDNHLAQTGGRTDFGEMAQMAAAESLAELVAPRSPTLFDTAPVEVREAVKGLSTQRGFSTLAHDFFAKLTRRLLNYHLSRELSAHVGPGLRFRDVQDHGRFLERLDHTCSQVALIVRDYAGEWYSKTNYEGGVNATKVRLFIHTSMRKLREELKRRGARRVA